MSWGYSDVVELSDGGKSELYKYSHHKVNF